ncbi:hypothetical protein BC629DRAFT_622989 [Irpex lacteus]|nr:hypothetical protein BC629DRAFT_622989 [Irpex lacteus]
MPFPFARSSRDIAPMPASPTSTSGSSSFTNNPLAIVQPITLLDPPQQSSTSAQEPPNHPDDEGVLDEEDDDAMDVDEDGDELAGPSHIEISDAIHDPHPFDPSYYDQEWYIALQNAAYARSAGTMISRGSPIAAAASRILVRHRPGMSSRFSTGPVQSSRKWGRGRWRRRIPVSPSVAAGGSPRIPASPSSPRSAWRMNLQRHRRGSTVGAPLIEGSEDDELGGETAGGIGHERNLRGTVQEPGVVLSGSSPKKWEWGLVPLQRHRGGAILVGERKGSRCVREEVMLNETEARTSSSGTVRFVVTMSRRIGH